MLGNLNAHAQSFNKSKCLIESILHKVCWVSDSQLKFHERPTTILEYIHSGLHRIYIVLSLSRICYIMDTCQLTVWEEF